jgi:hypothetical protein
MSQASGSLGCVLGGLVITFLGTRFITARIHARRGRLSDIKLGTLHLHHMIWGVGLVLLSGLLEFSLRPEWPSNAALAIPFGAGTALILDEFALILYLRDVYWSREGRRSIEAVLVMAVGLAMLGQLLDPGTLPDLRREFLVALVALWVVGIAVSLAKGKPFTALAGVLFPYLLMVGSVRLARPDSIWAHRFYRRNERKARRAEARFRPTRRIERARQRVFSWALEPASGSRLDLESAASSDPR